MALQTRVGSFSKINTVATQSITGVGFQPKVIIFWEAGSELAAATWAGHIIATYGFTTGPTNSYAIGAYSGDGIAASETARRIAAKCITFPNNLGNSVYAEADLQSFDSDGFTLNWTTNVAGGMAGSNIMYLALGGSDITNAKIVNWTTPTVAGNLAVTGVGFKPDIVFHAGTGQASVPASNTFIRFQTGVMNKHGQQWMNAFSGSTGANPTVTSRWQQTDACYGQIDEGEVIRMQSHYVSMDSDGFTTNFSTPLNGVSTISLCIKGVSSKISSFIKTGATAPAAQQVVRCGFQPRATMFTSVEDYPEMAPAAFSYWNLGASDGINQRYVALADRDNNTPTMAKSVYRTDAATGTQQSPGVTDGVASLTSMDLDGFTLTWNPNPTYSTEHLYLALGDASINTYPSIVNTSTSVPSTATATSNGRKIDRNQDGTLWTWDGISRLMYSKDNGITWTVDTSNTFSLTSNVSLFIDIDDYAHLIYKYSGDNYIYYNRGTPNAGRTSYTWSAGQVFNADVNYNFPDIVAHREGTGWKAHAVAGYISGTNNATHYARFNITSGGTITRDTVVGIDSAGGSGYVAAVNTYPSIDFNHTGDGKTVAGATPHLYAGWSAGKNGTDFGIRFKKATYSGGTWTWGTEREIDPNYHVATNQFFINCLFDGTRVIFPGMITNATSNEWITLHERDAADTTTTTRYLTNPNNAPDGVISGSASYDHLGNVYLIGRGEGITGYYLNLYKWTRDGASLSRITIEPVGGASGNPFVSAKRGSISNRVEWVYTSGDNSPYAVKYDYVSTAPFGFFIKKVKSITDLYREKMKARGFNI